ncbi:MAG: hypothetical protein ACRD8O_20900, partial [Bryobacteraceae bacterium]
MAEVNWSDAQWQKVSGEVSRAFDEASVASAFLDRYGGLAGGTETVRNERLLLLAKEATLKLDPDHPA